MTFFHRSTKGFREVQRIIVGKHALPRRHRETVTQQGDIHLRALFMVCNDFEREGFSQFLGVRVAIFPGTILISCVDPDNRLQRQITSLPGSPGYSPASNPSARRGLHHQVVA